MPDGVLCLRERIDDPDPESDGPDRSIEQPVGTGYPGGPAAGPTSAHFIPSGLLPVPRRLDVRRFLRIFDVAHQIHPSVRDWSMDRQTISHSPHFAAQRPERRVDLDWVRIGVFGLLIFYHVGMLYVSWEFHIKSAHRVTALEPLMLVLNPWRLALLFLVSGAATRFMLGKYAVGPLLRSRSVRLLIPLIFGMLVIVPPQAYDQIVESLGYPAGFPDFYARHYFAFGPQFCRPGPCILLPTWNHLWFVAYLWIYTMALGAVWVAVPGLVDWMERRLVPVLAGVGLLIVPSVALAAYRLAVLPSFPST